MKILLACVLAFIMIVTGLVLSQVSNLNTDITAKVLFVMIGVAALVFSISTWLWALRWPKVNESSPWRFVFGARPPDSQKIAAWRWGRIAWAAWVVVIAGLILLVLTHLDEVSL